MEDSISCQKVFEEIFFVCQGPNRKRKYHIFENKKNIHNFKIFAVKTGKVISAK